eukprot:CAMPEP_0114585106 /NCGR_PEP_ID=MMETSP0125-20121206/8764_1 /TAXON_ID=485358 ORGANISM="Aristerostoma sp., Strain ATCC 50986" /NCGR_SAMPLE_ID=MMETSP0125 /ASSEMBLY_ACC=CAM_ASM_000245 /LENGTH=54 /DNA_ID=CAMNT_0001780081 /DNA_START=2832 /DNA_END=2996 /DNA_ORIENTATION=-
MNVGYNEEHLFLRNLKGLIAQKQGNLDLVFALRLQEADFDPLTQGIDEDDDDGD